MSEWQPIETAPKHRNLLLGHAEKKWIRFGQQFPGMKDWYYSGTTERSQYAQVKGDEPTHWMPLPQPPS